MRGISGRQLLVPGRHVGLRGLVGGIRDFLGAIA